jgi:hypothetical protein
LKLPANCRFHQILQELEDFLAIFNWDFSDGTLDLAGLLSFSGTTIYGEKSRKRLSDEE